MFKRTSWVPLYRETRGSPGVGGSRADSATRLPRDARRRAVLRRGRPPERETASPRERIRRKDGRQASLLMPCRFEGEGREPGSETRFAEGTGCHVRQTQFTTTEGARGLKGGAARCPPPCFIPLWFPGDPRRQTLPLGLLGSLGSGGRKAAAGQARSRSRHAPSGAPFGLCRCVLLRGRAHGGTFPGPRTESPTSASAS